MYDYFRACCFLANTVAVGIVLRYLAYIGPQVEWQLLLCALCLLRRQEDLGRSNSGKLKLSLELLHFPSA